MLQLQNKKSNKGPLWLVEPKYSIGSDASCDIAIDHASVNSNHAELRVSGDKITVVNTSGGEILVNDEAVVDEHVMAPGAILRVGLEEFELVDPKTIKAESKASEVTTSGWALKALNTALADKHFPLQGSQVIGRSQECDVSLGVVHLSRKHAKVTVTDKGLVIEDLNSSNGTYINSKKVGKGTAIAGDELSFDTLRFRVIGPIIDDDKTTVRPSSGDGDLTTIRPALNLSEELAAKSSAEKPKSRPRPSTATSNKPTTAEQPGARPAPTHRPDDIEAKGYGMLWVGAAVLIGAGVAWYFLK